MFGVLKAVMTMQPNDKPIKPSLEIAPTALVKFSSCDRKLCRVTLTLRTWPR